MVVIRVKVKNVYGNDLNYPLNYISELNALTGRKTLTERDIRALEGLGFEIVFA